MPPLPKIPASTSDFSILQQNLNDVSQMFQVGQEQTMEVEEPIDISSRMVNGQLKYDFGNVPAQALEKLQGILKTHGEAIGAMQQREQFLAEQEARARKNPIMNVLTSLAGNLAVGDERLPPFVQALGKTSLQLNPPPDQIARERTELAGKIATQTEADIRTQYQLLEFVDRQETNKYIKQQDLDRKDKLRIQDAIEFVTKVGMGPESVDAAKAAYGLTDSEAKMLNKLIEDKNRRVKLDQEFKEGMQARDLASREKVGAIKNAISERWRMAQMEQRWDMAAAGREFRAYQVVDQPLVGITKTLADLKRMEQLLSDPLMTKYIGVIAGHVDTNTIPNAQDRERAAYMRSEFFGMLNSMKDFFGAGSYFWRPQEFANLTPKLMLPTDTLAATRGKLQAIRDSAYRAGRMMVQGSPDVDWRTHGVAFGSDAEAIVGKNVGGIQGPAGGRRVVGGPAPAAAPGTPGTTLDWEKVITQFFQPEKK